MLFLKSKPFTGIATMVLLLTLVLFFFQTGFAKEKTKRGYLGVSVQEMTPSLKDALKLNDRRGLLINDLVEDGPAADAGIREGDVILAFDGKQVERIKELTRLVRKAAPRSTVKVSVFRDGEAKSFDVKIGKKRSAGSWTQSFDMPGGGFAFRAAGPPRLGVKVHKLDKDLAAYFKTMEDGGVLVLGVEEDSPAEKAGLKSGDVITRLDDVAVQNPEELIEELQEFEPEEIVNLELIRNGVSTKVEVELEGSAHGLKGKKFHYGSKAPRTHFFHDGDFDVRLFSPHHGKHDGNEIIEERRTRDGKEIIIKRKKIVSKGTI